MHELAQQIQPGEHCGYGCFDLQSLAQWFTVQEQRRLKHLGFHIVSVETDRVLREDKLQVFFTRRLPLNIDAVILPWAVLHEYADTDSTQ